MQMRNKRPGLLFSGQGAQYVGMGKSLCEQWPIAREYYDRADQILGWRLSHACFEGPEDLLTQTKVCQLALFVQGIVIFEILKNEGTIESAGAVTGLSLGEITALTAAEAMNFETGLQLVAERARLMQEACEKTAGSMASVIGGAPSQVEELCRECGLQIANLNCPGQIVISGEKQRILDALQRGRGMGFKLVKELQVAGAYHSRLMESARKGFRPFVQAADISEPKCPFYANVSGQCVQDVAKIREGLVEQVVSSVRFEDCLRSMGAALPQPVEMVECGPAKILAGLVRRTESSWTVYSFSESSDFAD